MIEKATIGLTGRIDHHAGKTALRHERNEAFVSATIRKHDAYQAGAARQRYHGADTILSLLFGIKSDLDVTCAGVSDRRCCSCDSRRCHLKFARHRTHRPSARNRINGRPYHRGSHCAEGTADVLKIDYVSAVPNSNFSLFHAGHACEHESHQKTPSLGA